MFFREIFPNVREKLRRCRPIFLDLIAILNNLIEWSVDAGHTVEKKINDDKFVDFGD